MNLNCDPVRTALGAYMDGELSELEASAIDVHLGQCAACVAELAELRGASEELRELFLDVLAQAPVQALPRRRSKGLVWGALLAAAATLLLWFQWPAEQAGERLDFKVQLCSAIEGFLSKEYPSMVTERGQLRFESLWEAEGERFAWGDFGQAAAQSPFPMRGGGGGGRIWIEAFGGVLGGASEGHGRWLPAELQVRWPAGIGPSGVLLLHALVRGEFEVTSTEWQNGQLAIRIESEAQQAWSSATLRLGADGEWLAAEWNSATDPGWLRMQALQRSLQQSEDLLAYGPKEMFQVDSDPSKKQRAQLLQAIDIQFRVWLRGWPDQENLNALHGLGYTGGD